MSTDRRLELHEELKAVLNSSYVYFQPPESVKMRYPAVVYELQRIETRHADDEIYRMHDCYSVTYITNDPDSPIPHDLLRRFQYIRFDRAFRSDNLYHYTYTLYY